MRRFLTAILLGLSCACHAQVDDSFDTFRKNALQGMSAFRDSVKTEYQNFRQKINAEYASFLRGIWKDEQSQPAPPPLEEPAPAPPVIFPEEDRQKPVEDNPVEIEEEPRPAPAPQPMPVAPVEEVPTVPVFHQFNFYGADLKVRLSPSQTFRLSDTKPHTIGDLWERLSAADYANLVYDCLQVRQSYSLCDWAYLQMLAALSEQYFKGKCNEATFLTAYLFCQSGYTIRLGEWNGQLYLLVGTPHQIYHHGYYTIDGNNYFVYNANPDRLNVCDVKFQGESMLSFYVPQLPKLPESLSEMRILCSERYADMKVASQVNRNLLEFYSQYPTSVVGNNVCTRWAMYAETPLCTPVERHVVKVLKEKLKNCDEPLALNKLLNFVQTAFVYEYDDKVWGGDRAFFGDETLFYPYCDCEDRSILFSKLVREILGLEVLLIYYPGHLATAVHTRTDIAGDYILLNGKRFLVCDPTYVGAPIGKTMPEMDNQSAKVILLN